jgi:cytoskeletal protein CcmA (bactofilin family)
MNLLLNSTSEDNKRRKRTMQAIIKCIMVTAFVAVAINASGDGRKDYDYGNGRNYYGDGRNDYDYNYNGDGRNDYDYGSGRNYNGDGRYDSDYDYNNGNDYRNGRNDYGNGRGRDTIISGTQTFHTAVSYPGNLLVTGTLTVNGEVTVGGRVRVSGGGTMTVTGALSARGPIIVSDGATLTVTGAVRSSSLICDSTVTITGPTDIGNVIKRSNCIWTLTS